MDFSSLSDEQLLQLLEAVLKETIVRGDVVANAAREVMLSEKEKADIARQAAEKVKDQLKREEADRVAREAGDKVRAQQLKAEEQKKANQQKKMWVAKKDQAVRLMELLPDSEIWVNVWKSAGGEKRVYLNDGEPFGRKTREISCLFVTGNHKQAPGSMTESSYLKAKDETVRKGVKDLCIEIANYWNSVTFDCQQAADYEPAT